MPARNTLLLVGGVIFGFIVIGNLFKARLLAINEGTPFEGAGVLGTLGNVTDAASGGLLSAAGSRIGLFFSDLTDTRTLDELTAQQPVGIIPPPNLG